MKRFFHIWVLVMPALLWTACNERTPDLYSAPDGICFNNRTAGNVLLDTATFTFVYEKDETRYMDVPVVVQSIGRQSAGDRAVAIRVWSENAVEGVDYELLTPAVMPANTSSFSYVVRLRRTTELRTAVKSVQLELSANEWFSTFLTVDSTQGGSRPVEMLKYRIDFSDFYSTAPQGWREEYVGVFSERKLRLMWKLFDGVVAREDYNVKGGIPFNKWVYMQRELQTYMYEQETILKGYDTTRELDPDALVDPTAESDERRLLDFTPVVSGN